VETKAHDLILWGHSLADYRLMFHLTDQDVTRSIVDVASGFASFNAEMHAQDKRVISCDKVYDLSEQQLAKRIDKTLQTMLGYVGDDIDRFVWVRNKSLADFEKKRRSHAAQFLQDFAQGKQQGRYCHQQLPKLSFQQFQFELALCSHFLFADSSLSTEFHVAAICEMCRVAHEARIFPILDSSGEIASEVGPIMLLLQQKNYGVEVREVDYQFQKGGNAMLRVWATECGVEHKY